MTLRWVLSMVLVACPLILLALGWILERPEREARRSMERFDRARASLDPRRRQR